jgi:methylenetetrahydrofolate reductase (NADPH)
LSAGRFAVTAEITPPLAADAAALLAKTTPLKGRVDAVNVTDAADGDDPAGGDQPEATPVYDLDTKGVIGLIRQMRDEGLLPSGRAMERAPHFFIGAADTPHDPAPDWRPTGLLAKVEAGADFVQTQFCFDLKLAHRYLARLSDAGIPERLKILIGIGPIASVRSARWMNENLFGVSVPDAVIDRLEKAVDAEAEGRRLCTELMQGLQEVPGVSGVHIMAPNQSMESVAQVIDESGLRNESSVA